MNHILDLDDRWVSPLEPHVILPAQFFRRTAWTGEQRLMAAILEDAARVCQRGRAGRTVTRKTLAWIGSSDRTWVFSFLNICSALKLDAGQVRRALVKDPTRRPQVAAPRSEPVYSLAASG